MERKTASGIMQVILAASLLTLAISMRFVDGYGTCKHDGC